MAWSTTKATENQMLYQTETISGASTAKAYTSEIDFLHMGPYGGVRWIRFAATPDVISGSNYDVDLEGCYLSGGTKITLVSAVIADMTVNATEVAVTSALDLWLYPMPYYYLAFLSDADETGNEIAVTITAASAVATLGM